MTSYELKPGQPIRDAKIADIVVREQLGLILAKLDELAPEARSRIASLNGGPLQISCDWQPSLNAFGQATLRVASPLVYGWIQTALKALDGDAERRRVQLNACLPLLMLNEQGG